MGEDPERREESSKRHDYRRCRGPAEIRPPQAASPTNAGVQSAPASASTPAKMLSGHLTNPATR